MTKAVITAANSITPVGHDGRMTSAAVRAGSARLFSHRDFVDGRGKPVTVAQIGGIEDDNRDTPARLGSIAARCLGDLLSEYAGGAQRRPSQVKLLLGVASLKRPGPRYEESCIRPLLAVVNKWVPDAELQTIPQGNGSMPHAVAAAERLLESSPGTLCIIGAIDSLVRDSTLSWFEEKGRLKSRSHGRQHGLIAGEAVSFLVIEDGATAEASARPVLARVAGVGVAEEPIHRASNQPGRNSGLTEACRAAMGGVGAESIRAVVGDLNGENSRAREWSEAEMRCFDRADAQRKVWRPAESYGDIGAASGAVAANIVTQGFVRGWLPSPVLIFCSDDHGACGAVVLEKDRPCREKGEGGSSRPAREGR